MLITRLPRHVCVVALVAAAGLSACGSDGADADTDNDTTSNTADAAESEASATDAASADSSDAPATGETVAVKALDNTFIEDSVDVAAGTEVVWKNGGRNDHDIVPVADDESWGVGIEAFHPGDEYSHVFTEPGEYAYYCTIHGTADVGMTGTIIVT